MDGQKAVRSLAFFVLAIAPAAAPIHAQTVMVPFIECGDWAKARKLSSKSVAWRAESAKLEKYVSGVLAGIAMHSGVDILGDKGDESFFFWMDNYCASDPLSNITSGSHKLAVELAARRGQPLRWPKN